MDRLCGGGVVVRYRPMRGGQMTPPDVVRGHDDQIAARTAWNQASLSMQLLRLFFSRFSVLL